MTTITFDEDIKLSKTHFKTVKEFNFKINNFSIRKNKLSPIEIINKYNLNKTYIWDKIDISKEINNIAYNL